MAAAGKKQRPKISFVFVGNAFLFDKQDVGHVKVETSAVSLPKAKTNICYKIKQDMGLRANTPMTLYGRIVMTDDSGNSKVIRLT